MDDGERFKVLCNKQSNSYFRLTNDARELFRKTVARVRTFAVVKLFIVGLSKSLRVIRRSTSSILQGQIAGLNRTGYESSRRK